MTAQTLYFTQPLRGFDPLAAKRRELDLRDEALQRKEAALKADPEYQRWQEDDALFAECGDWEMVRKIRQTIPAQQITAWKNVR